MRQIPNYKFQTPKKSTLFLLGIWCLGFGICNLPHAYAVTSAAEADALIQSRQGAWIAFKAGVKLEVTTPEGHAASCDGQIAYERLNERMMLLCVDPKKGLLFAFKSEDRDFEFYQPASQTLYQGTIFDLEDDPDLHSHIKPLALYRSLKPGALPDDLTRIEYQDPEGFRLSVKGKFHEKRFVKRRIWVTSEGDVDREIYLNPQGQEVLKILRLEFEKIKKQGLSRRESYVFPHQITFEELLSHRKTTLKLDSFDFTPLLASNSWNLPVPPSTKRVKVSEAFETLQRRVH